MLKYKFLRLMAAALVIGLTGCSKEDVNVSDEVDKGAAKMLITIKVPQSDGSRAGQASDQKIDGTTQENAMGVVDVYVFRADGLAASIGTHKRLQISTDFTVAGSGAKAVYTSKAENAIETRSGASRIYVGVNLPGADFDRDFVSEAALLEETANVSEIFTDNAFYFFSDVAEQNLAPYNAEDPASSLNKVSLALDRVTAKVAVSAIGDKVVDGKIQVSWDEHLSDRYAAEGYGGLMLTYQTRHFRPYQDASVTYVGPNYVPSGMFTGNNTYLGQYLTYSPGPTPTTVGNHYPYLYSFAQSNGKAAENVYTGALPANLNDLPTHYVGENRPYTIPKFANTTYVMVATQVLVEKAADWNAGNGMAEYTAVTPYGNAATVSDVFVVKVLTGDEIGKFYVTDTNEKATRIFEGLGGDANAKIFTYAQGYVHFPVYLDGYGYGDTRHDYYGVFRNQFIRVNITGIAGDGGYGDFPGIPGDPADPTKPGVNPTDPKDDPKDPTGPNAPEDPIDAYRSELLVEIIVNPWYYLINDGVILQ